MKGELWYSPGSGEKKRVTLHVDDAKGALTVTELFVPKPKVLAAVRYDALRSLAWFSHTAAPGAGAAAVKWSYFIVEATPSDDQPAAECPAPCTFVFSTAKQNDYKRWEAALQQTVVRPAAAGKTPATCPPPMLRAVGEDHTDLASSRKEIEELKTKLQLRGDALRAAELERLSAVEACKRQVGTLRAERGLPASCPECALLSGKLDGLTAEVQQLSTHRAQDESLAATLAHTREDNLRLQHNLRAAGKELKELRRLIAAADPHAAPDDKPAASPASALRGLARKFSQRAAAVQSLEAELAAQAAALAGKGVELAGLRADIEAEREAGDAAERRAAAAQAESERLQSVLQATEEELHRTREESSSLQHRLTALETTKPAEEAEAPHAETERLQSVLQATEEELLRTREEAGNLQHRLTAFATSKAAEEAKASSVLQATEEELHRTREEASSLQHRLAAFEKGKAAEEAEVSQAESERLQAVEKELLHTREEASSLQHRLAALETGKAAEEAEAAQALLRAREEALSASETSNAAARAEAERLRSVLQATEEELLRKRDEASSLQHRLSALETSKAAEEAEAAQAESENHLSTEEDQLRLREESSHLPHRPSAFETSKAGHTESEDLQSPEEGNPREETSSLSASETEVDSPARSHDQAEPPARLLAALRSTKAALRRARDEAGCLQRRLDDREAERRALHAERDAVVEKNDLLELYLREKADDLDDAHASLESAARALHHLREEQAERQRAAERPPAEQDSQRRLAEVASLVEDVLRGAREAPVLVDLFSSEIEESRRAAAVDRREAAMREESLAEQLAVAKEKLATLREIAFRESVEEAVVAQAGTDGCGCCRASGCACLDEAAGVPPALARVARAERAGRERICAGHREIAASACATLARVTARLKAHGRHVAAGAPFDVLDEFQRGLETAEILLKIAKPGLPDAQLPPPPPVITTTPSAENATYAQRPPSTSPEKYPKEQTGRLSVRSCVSRASSASQNRSSVAADTLPATPNTTALLRSLYRYGPNTARYRPPFAFAPLNEPSKAGTHPWLVVSGDPVNIYAYTAPPAGEPPLDQDHPQPRRSLSPFQPVRIFGHEPHAADAASFRGASPPGRLSGASGSSRLSLDGSVAAPFEDRDLIVLKQAYRGDVLRTEPFYVEVTGTATQVAIVDNVLVDGWLRSKDVLAEESDPPPSGAGEESAPRTTRMGENRAPAKRATSALGPRERDDACTAAAQPAARPVTRTHSGAAHPARAVGGDAERGAGAGVARHVTVCEAELLISPPGSKFSHHRVSLCLPRGTRVCVLEECSGRVHVTVRTKGWAYIKREVSHQDGSLAHDQQPQQSQQQQQQQHQGRPSRGASESPPPVHTFLEPVQGQGWVVTGKEGILARTTRSLDSPLVAGGSLRFGTPVEVAEVVGIRARIVSPIEGWVSITSQAGYTILERASAYRQAWLERNLHRETLRSSRLIDYEQEHLMYKSLEGELVKRDRQVCQLTKEVTHLRHEKAELETYADDHDRVLVLESLLAETKEASAHYLQQKKDQRSRADAFEKQVHELRKRTEDLHMEATVARKRAADVAREKDALSGEIGENRRAAAAAAECLQAELDGLRTDYEAKCGDEAMLQSALGEATMRLEAQDVEASTARAALAAADEQLGETRAALYEAEHRTLKTESELAAATARVEAGEAKIRSLSDSIARVLHSYADGFDTAETGETSLSPQPAGVSLLADDTCTDLAQALHRIDFCLGRSKTALVEAGEAKIRGLSDSIARVLHSYADSFDTAESGSETCPSPPGGGSPLVDDACTDLAQALRRIDTCLRRSKTDLFQLSAAEGRLTAEEAAARAAKAQHQAALEALQARIVQIVGSLPQAEEARAGAGDPAQDLPATPAEGGAAAGSCAEIGDSAREESADPAQIRGTRASAADPAQAQEAHASAADPAQIREIHASAADPAQAQEAHASAADPAQIREIHASAADPAQAQEAHADGALAALESLASRAAHLSARLLALDAALRESEAAREAAEASGRDLRGELQRVETRLLASEQAHQSRADTRTARLVQSEAALATAEASGRDLRGELQRVETRLLASEQAHQSRADTLSARLVQSETARWGAERDAAAHACDASRRRIEAEEAADFHSCCCGRLPGAPALSCTAGGGHQPHSRAAQPVNQEEAAVGHARPTTRDSDEKAAIAARRGRLAAELAACDLLLLNAGCAATTPSARALLGAGDAASQSAGPASEDEGGKRRSTGSGEEERPAGHPQTRMSSAPGEIKPSPADEGAASGDEGERLVGGRHAISPTADHAQTRTSSTPKEIEQPPAEESTASGDDGGPYGKPGDGRRGSAAADHPQTRTEQLRAERRRIVADLRACDVLLQDTRDVAVRAAGAQTPRLANVRTTTTEHLAEAARWRELHEATVRAAADAEARLQAELACLRGDVRRLVEGNKTLDATWSKLFSDAKESSTAQLAELAEASEQTTRECAHWRDLHAEAVRNAALAESALRAEMSALREECESARVQVEAEARALQEARRSAEKHGAERAALRALLAEKDASIDALSRECEAQAEDNAQLQDDLLAARGDLVEQKAVAAERDAFERSLPGQVQPLLVGRQRGDGLPATDIDYESLENSKSATKATLQKIIANLREELGEYEADAIVWKAQIASLEQEVKRNASALSSAAELKNTLAAERAVVEDLKKKLINSEVSNASLLAVRTRLEEVERERCRLAAEADRLKSASEASTRHVHELELAAAENICGAALAVEQSWTAPQTDEARKQLACENASLRKDIGHVTEKYRRAKKMLRRSASHGPAHRAADRADPARSAAARASSASACRPQPRGSENVPPPAGGGGQKRATRRSSLTSSSSSTAAPAQQQQKRATPAHQRLASSLRTAALREKQHELDYRPRIGGKPLTPGRSTLPTTPNSGPRTRGTLIGITRSTKSPARSSPLRHSQILDLDPPDSPAI
ncbi:hypothetical protein DIPPA_01894 [Diplonema papillatum]|nr:hypothetical protein DIPPA_01894 [Diplonema papillatum]